ncbi:MAG: hypothetical protein ACN4GZ_02880 [Acidimicrobiales bacterium]
MSEDSGPSAVNSNPLADASGEGLISIGAMLVLGSWFVFEIITEDHFVTGIAVALAILILVLPRLDPDSLSAVAPSDSLIKLAAYGLAAVGGVEIIEEIRSGVLDNGAATVIGALIAYAGYVLAFLGARKA